MSINTNYNPCFKGVVPVVILQNGTEVTDPKTRGLVTRQLSRIANGNIKSLEELKIQDDFEAFDMEFRIISEKKRKTVKLKTATDFETGQQFLLTGKHADILAKKGYYIGKGRKEFKDALVPDADMFIDTRLPVAENNLKNSNRRYYEAAQEIINCKENWLRNTNNRLLKLIVNISTYGQNNSVYIKSADFKEITPRRPVQLDLF
jgi:hypothetical protein